VGLLASAREMEEEHEDMDKLARTKLESKLAVSFMVLLLLWKLFEDARHICGVADVEPVNDNDIFVSSFVRVGDSS